MKKRLISKSRFLSLVLRHSPETIGLKLDPQGWLEIDRLIEHAKATGTTITLAELHEIVATNDKKRFALSDDGRRIRASQGHSVADVDLQFEPVVPPNTLFHGTVERFLQSIRNQGLLRGTRTHVHLSPDEATAMQVGSRRGTPVVLSIDAVVMHDDGHWFYRSANGVWLTERVPAKYIQFP